MLYKYLVGASRRLALQLKHLASDGDPPGHPYARLAVSDVVI